MIEPRRATRPPRPQPSGGQASWRSAARAVFRRLTQIIPAAALGAGILLVALLTTPGCPQPAGAPKRSFAKLEGVPEIRVLLASGQSVRLAVAGPYRILADADVVDHSDVPLAPADLGRSGSLWRLGASTYRGGTLTLEPAGHAPVRIGQTSYRGRIVFHPRQSDAWLAVNHVDLENYLPGVLAKELLTNWHENAYQAQAIAARTYALYEKYTFGPSHAYDLQAGQSSQAYGGHSAETAKSRRAAAATRGVVLAFGPEGGENIFRTYYSSCCGGMTNNVGVIYGPCVGSGPLAGGAACTDCAGSGQYRWPAVRVRKDALHRALGRSFPAIAALSGVKTIEVASEIHGRPVWVNVVSPRGEKVKIRADEVRIALLRDGQGKGIYSMSCPIRDADEFMWFGPGRGFGHGVGLCQWGAQGMASRGCSVEEILHRYYPGAKLIKAYH